MARTAINFVLVTSGGGPTTYTVPAGKYVIGKAFANGADYNVMVNSINLGRVSSTTPVGPIVANAGDVITMNGAGSGGFSGFLYDA